jgi:hypothetical protein
MLMNPGLFPTGWAMAPAACVLLGAAARADSLLVVNTTSPDPGQGGILRYDATTGAPIGGGPPVAAGGGGLDGPTGLALGPDGSLPPYAARPSIMALLNARVKRTSP